MDTFKSARPGSRPQNLQTLICKLTKDKTKANWAGIEPTTQRKKRKNIQKKKI